MFKQFLSPLSRLWDKTLKTHKIPATLRSALLILLAMAVIEISLFGSVVIGIAVIIKVIA